MGTGTELVVREWTLSSMHTPRPVCQSNTAELSEGKVSSHVYIAHNWSKGTLMLCQPYVKFQDHDYDSQNWNCLDTPCEEVFRRESFVRVSCVVWNVSTVQRSCATYEQQT